MKPEGTPANSEAGPAKQASRPLSRSERRRLAELEEIEYQKRKQRERALKNAKQICWVLATVMLVVVLAVGMIRLI